MEEISDADYQPIFTNGSVSPEGRTIGLMCLAVSQLVFS
jgi:hypothetical protein